MPNIVNLNSKLEKAYSQWVKTGIVSNYYTKFLKDYIQNRTSDFIFKSYDLIYFLKVEILRLYINKSLDKKKSIEHFIIMFAMNLDYYTLRLNFQPFIKSNPINETIANMRDKLQILLLDYFEENPNDYKYSLRKDVEFIHAIQTLLEYIGFRVDSNLPKLENLNTIIIPEGVLIEIYNKYFEASIDPLKTEFNENQIEILDSLYKTFGYIDSDTNEFIFPDISIAEEYSFWLFLFSNENVKNPRVYKYFLSPFKILPGKSFNKNYPFKSIQNDLKSQSSSKRIGKLFDEFSLYLHGIRDKYYGNGKIPQDVKVFFLTFLDCLCKNTNSINYLSKDGFSPSYYDKPPNPLFPSNDPWRIWTESRKTSKKRLR